jgi:hypothetical protein
MSKLISTNDFEPTRQYKDRMAQLRKEPRQVSDIKLPGLFDSYNYETIKRLFFLAIIFEIVSLYMLYGDVENNLYLLIPFFFDVILAVAAQYFFESKICVAANKELVSKSLEVSFDEKRNFKYSIDSSKSTKATFKLLKGLIHLVLLGIAAYKIYLSFIYFSGTKVSLYFLITIQFLTAILHILYTGSFFLEWRLRSELAKHERNFGWLDDMGKNASPYKVSYHREFNIDKNDLTKIATSLEPAKTSKHELKKDGDNYILVTWGMFEDEDLYNLIDAQKNVNQKKALALFGLRHQLEILDGDAFKK